MLPKSHLAALAAIAAAAAACSGSNHATADAFWNTGPAEEERSRPLRQTEELSSTSPTPLTAESESPAWVGVRHDLMLAPSPDRKAKCTCLAVEVGDPKDPKFQWVAGPPDSTHDTMAIALSARGVDCPGGQQDEEKRRPSISAVDQEGNNVIVEVEELPQGRPLATGAVIPKPAAGGGIYIKGRTSALPYARPGTNGPCKVL